MPCVTVGAAEAEELMRRVEADPALEVAIDLEAMTVSAGDLQVSSALAAAAREAFLDGSWDATALLLDRYDDVERVASRLPYISAFSAGSG
jgi:3-isopropylmalate dehydratase small subunit